MYDEIINLLENFPLKSGIQLKEDSIISSSIDIFSSILLERIKSKFQEKFPGCHFDEISSNSSIKDIYYLILNSDLSKSKKLIDNDFHYISNFQEKKINSNQLHREMNQLSKENLSVGIDLEHRKSIPEDILILENSSFRERLFSVEEIIYSITKPDPIITLTGIFSSKEAVIKSLSKFYKIRLNKLILVIMKMEYLL